jgi:hypothetical protein
MITTTLPRDNSQLSAKAQASLGLPAGFKIYSPFPFTGGMNQTDSRVALDDKELFYVENLLRIGNGRYRSLWDVGSPLLTAPVGKTIVSFFWFNVGFNFFCAVFYSDGTADEVSTAGVITHISTTINTFYRGSGTPLPVCCQSGTALLLIANNNTPNDYWIWDGTLLYQAGTLAPIPTVIDGGAGYTSAPTITAYGGAGSGASFTSRVSGGSVIAVDISNPGTGYNPGDIVQLLITGGGADSGAELLATITGGSLSSIVVSSRGSGYTSAPTVAITGGGGAGATAIAVLGTGSTAGQVIQIVILNPGTGYTGTPAVGFSGGGGTGAAAVALLNPGGVTSISVVQGGTNFSGTPLLTIIGGGGSGATATANMAGGQIASVTITLTGAGYTSTPAVVVQTAVNNAAAATVTLMPFGVCGYSMEVYTGRVFVGPPSPTGAGHLPNGGAFFVSAPGSLTDFATSDGGLLFTTTDRFLRSAYTNFRQSSGYLYPFGDSSISVISNVQTGGAPTQTTFTYQNIDPQNGSRWRDTCQDFARTILFANPFGVFGLYGGAVTKVSQKIERIFQNALFPTTSFPTTGQPVFPSSAVANIFNMKCYMLLADIPDVLTGVSANTLLVWNEHDWSVCKPSKTLIYIGTQEIASNLVAWGTDGTTLFPLFSTPSGMTKTLSSKLYGVDLSFVTKQAMATYMQALDVAGTGVTFSLTLENEMGGWVTNADSGFKNWTQYSEGLLDAPPPVAAVPDSAFLAARGLDVIGQELGFTITSTSQDFEIYQVQLAYLDVGSVFG